MLLASCNSHPKTEKIASFIITPHQHSSPLRNAKYLDKQRNRDIGNSIIYQRSYCCPSIDRAGGTRHTSDSKRKTCSLIRLPVLRNFIHGIFIIYPFLLNGYYFFHITGFHQLQVLLQELGSNLYCIRLPSFCFLLLLVPLLDPLLASHLNQTSDHPLALLHYPSSTF